MWIEENKYVKNSKLIELVPLRDDKIVTWKSDINQNIQIQKNLSKEEQDEDNKDSYREKPWIVYLKTLRIPIICPIHRKLFLMISENFKTPEPQTSKSKKNNFSSISSMKRMMNRNPNWNHNSSQFYNSCIVNVKFDKDTTSDDKSQNLDLLWKNSELYPEKDEINSLATVLYKLFTNPRLGENVPCKKSKLKTIAGIWCS